MHLSWDEVLADRERDAARKQRPPGPWEGAGPWAWRVWPRGGDEHVHRRPGPGHEHICPPEGAGRRVIEGNTTGPGYSF